jgi:pimeloyl-ACP methyl ester carboxylesterase
MTAAVKTVAAGVLEVAFLEYGDPGGWPCVLGHGFPYDAHAYAEAAPMLAEAGARVVVPWLRGYGATRFLSPDTPRSGEQAALGADMLALMDALGIERAVVGGYDWGGRAACIVAALWPERVTALVSGNSYNIQDIPRSWEPASPEAEAAYWYQWYFGTERGRRGLAANRRGLAELLWRMWSPEWAFDDETFARSARAFDNADFVEVVIHSYRHRYGLVPGDPGVAHIETRLTAQPPIAVPSVTVDGAADGVSGTTQHHAPRFTGRHRHRIWPGAGHNLPQERPRDWADAVLEAVGMADSRAGAGLAKGLG